MRLPGWCLLAVIGGVGGVLAAPNAQVRTDDFQVSFAAGARDATGRFAGGTARVFLEELEYREIFF